MTRIGRKQDAVMLCQDDGNNIRLAGNGPSVWRDIPYSIDICIIRKSEWREARAKLAGKLCWYSCHGGVRRFFVFLDENMLHVWGNVHAHLALKLSNYFQAI
jgi:hypothetical protein